MSLLYNEYRCQGCEKLLFKGVLIDSKIEVKCKSCKLINVFEGEAANQYICLKGNCANRIKAVE